jgi:hypothetical protein
LSTGKKELQCDIGAAAALSGNKVVKGSPGIYKVFVLYAWNKIWSKMVLCACGCGKTQKVLPLAIL